jgi:2-dehydro-3-deoxygluconokinase
MPTTNTPIPDIVALGEPLVEFSAAETGPLSSVTRFKVGCGGDTSNFAVAVSRLGGRAGYISRVGKDPFADILFDCWKKEGVDCSKVIQDEAWPTGLYFTSRESGCHHFTYYRRDSAASRMDPDDLPIEYIRKAKWLHVSGISQAISPSAGRTVDRAVDAAHDAGLMVSYDPNLRLKLWSVENARTAIDRMAVRADVFLPSYEDAIALTGEKRPEMILSHYLSLGCRQVVLKMGADGALLGDNSSGGRYGAKIEKISAFSVEVVDASGAGDTFDAAFVVARLEGRPAVECVRFANAAGALVAAGIGTITPIPTRGAVEDLMDTQT